MRFTAEERPTFRLLPAAFCACPLPTTFAIQWRDVWWQKILIGRVPSHCDTTHKRLWFGSCSSGNLLAEIACNGMAAYSATKGGARGFSRSDALDYGPEGIRVNTVAPGPTTTHLLIATQSDQFISKMESVTPLQRNARPEDIANAIVWLSSERASFITGVSLVVDGGLGLESGIWE